MKESVERCEPNHASLALIRFRSRQLVGRYGFTAADREDIEQDLQLHWLRQQRRYDPNQSSVSTFLDRVTRNKIASLIEAQKAKKRDWRRRLSLSDVHSSDGRPDDHFGISASPFFRVHEICAGETQILQIDVARVVRTLPPPLRLIAVLIVELESATEVAAAMQISRKTLYRRIEQIYDVFLKAGLQQYVCRPERRRGASK